MRTARHPLRQVLPVAGMGLMLAGLFGGPILPVASAAGVEAFAHQHHWGPQAPWGSQTPWGPQEYRGSRDPWGDRGERWGDRHDRRSRRSGGGLPDRYTIHKGKKCELRCERIRGTRDYSCREYRC